MALVFLPSTVCLDEFIHGEVSATNSDDYLVTLDLHEDSLAVVPVDTRTFSLESSLELTSDPHGELVDHVGKLRINWVILEGHVSELTVHLLSLLEGSFEIVNLPVSLFELLEKLECR